jgi:opacity protein-like surface antigen
MNMKRFILACALLLPLLAVAAVPEFVQRLAGSFSGEVFNGTDLDPVVTSFSLDRHGRLSGSYTVDEENGAYSGILTNIVFEDASTISMEWTDKFGEGFARLQFNGDFSSFTGEWTDKDGTGGLPWSGQRQSP